MTQYLIFRMSLVWFIWAISLLHMPVVWCFWTIPRWLLPAVQHFWGLHNRRWPGRAGSLSQRQGCDITYDITVWYYVTSHMMISHCDVTCDVTYDMEKMNMISHIHMMCLFVAYDFTCDITVFLLWYHIMVISHCDITMWHHMWYAATSHDIHIWHHIWYHSLKCDIIVWLWYHIIMISQSENHDITYDIIVWYRLGIHMIS